MSGRYLCCVKGIELSFARDLEGEESVVGGLECWERCRAALSLIWYHTRQILRESIFMSFSKVHLRSQQSIKEVVDANQDSSPYQLILVQRSAYSAGYQHQQQASAGQITNDGLNNQAPWAQSTIPSRGFSRNVESAPDSTDTSSSVNRLISVLNRLRRA